MLAGSGSRGNLDGSLLTAQFKVPNAIAVAPNGLTLFVGEDSGNALRTVDLVAQTVITLSGSGSQGTADGVGTAATFSSIASLAIDPTGTLIFVVQGLDSNLRLVTLGNPCSSGSFCGAGSSVQVAWCVNCLL